MSLKFRNRIHPLVHLKMGSSNAIFQRISKKKILQDINFSEQLCSEENLEKSCSQQLRLEKLSKTEKN